MNNRTSNQLNMVGSCINVATSKDYINVWTGQAPPDFEADMAQLQTDFAAVTAKAALAESATGGGGDAKANAETLLENSAFIMARALVNHFRKTGDLDRLGKVDVNKTDIVKLRNQALVDKATAIRDIANAAVSETDAANRGVTAARITALTAAISAFSNVMNMPRGQIVNRGTLLKEVETDTADLLDQLNDLDDLCLQFESTDLGKRFIEAWKRARIIVDTGGGRGNGHGNNPSPAPAPATPGK